MVHITVCDDLANFETEKQHFLNKKLVLLLIFVAKRFTKWCIKKSAIAPQFCL